jgi:hypothetical protein
MTEDELLDEMIKLFSDGTNWTQIANAIDEYNNPVQPEDPTAVAWSIAGAIMLLEESPIKAYIRVNALLTDINALLNFHPSYQFGYVYNSLEQFNNTNKLTPRGIVKILKQIKSGLTAHYFLITENKSVNDLERPLDPKDPKNLSKLLYYSPNTVTTTSPYTTPGTTYISYISGGGQGGSYTTNTSYTSSN